MATWDPSASTTVRRIKVKGLKSSTAEPRGAQEDCTSETPRKRRKREDKYQIFESEEKETLKKYEKLESKTRKILNKTYEKLFDVLSQGTMPDGIKYFKERLNTLKKKSSLDPICIGFLGRTGAGKTSLLNAILGKKLFMPVSGKEACTACIVQVKRSKSESYEAVIHLLTEEEWRGELKDLVKVLSKNGVINKVDSHESVRNASDKLRALYGTGAEEKSYEELLKAKYAVTIPAKRTISIKEKEVEAFSQKLGPYIRARKEGSVALWPLIKDVELDIPGSDLVPEGITFVDIPGTGDFNKTRDEMWKKSIDKCSVIWVIADIVRIEGEEVHEMLLNKSIKAYIGGICADIAMVVTKTDDLDLEEYETDRRNKTTPIENEHDAILERNQDVKESKETNIREKLKERVAPDSDVLIKGDLVYTVSAKEFWKKVHLSQEETEIPKLREYIRRLYLKEKERLVTDYVKETFGIHLLAENIGPEKGFVESGVDGFVNARIDVLGKDLGRCFRNLEQPLCDGVSQARRYYRQILERNLTRDGGYKGFHKTLKAVCLKNGVYASRTFARIDFNEDLAKPIYEKIENIFENIFRTRNRTRANLWFLLEMFKEDVQGKISQIARDNKILDGNSKIKAFIHETNVILMKLKAEILRRKIIIYQSLPASIQSDLRPYYKEASDINGQQTYGRMKALLMENIEREVENMMFEKAKSKMKSCFLELKEEIITMLKKETSIVLKLLLLQQDQPPVELPDIGQESREIKQLHDDM